MPMRRLRTYNPRSRGGTVPIPAQERLLPRARGAGARALARARRLPRVAAPPRGRAAVRLLRGPADGQRPARAPTTCWRACSRTSSRATRRCAGYYVERKGGWDCHGLPVEIAVEQQLGFDSKERHRATTGSPSSTQKCRESVFEFLEDWTRLTERIGYWVDLDAPLPHARRRPTSSRSGGRCSSCGSKRPALRGPGRPLLPALTAPRCPRTRSRRATRTSRTRRLRPLPGHRSRPARCARATSCSCGRRRRGRWSPTPPSPSTPSSPTCAPRDGERARRGAGRARARRGRRRSPTASRAPTWSAPATSRRSRSSPAEDYGEKGHTVLPGRLRLGRGRHRHRPHRDRVRRGRLPARRRAGAQRHQPRAARRHLRRAHRPLRRPLRQGRRRRPDRGPARARAAASAPSACCTPTRTAGAAARRCSTTPSRPGTSAPRRCATGCWPPTRPSTGTRSTSSTGASATGWRTTSTGRSARERYWGTPLPIWRCENGHVECDRLASPSWRSKSGATLEDPHRPYVDEPSWARAPTAAARCAACPR